MRSHLPRALCGAFFPSSRYVCVHGSIWMKNGRNKTNCEAVSTEGCRRLKTSGKASKCFIYHNMELALEWEESQRAVMYDPSKADYFLQCASH